MLHRIVVDVIEMVSQVSFVPDNMVPKSSLPQGFSVNVMLAPVQVREYELDSSHVIRSRVLSRVDYQMHVIWQNDPGDDAKRRAAFRYLNRAIQQFRIIDQDWIPLVSYGRYEDVITVSEVADEFRHGHRPHIR